MRQPSIHADVLIAPQMLPHSAQIGVVDTYRFRVIVAAAVHMRAPTDVLASDDDGGAPADKR